jgi:hypothetical protein
MVSYLSSTQCGLFRHTSIPAQIFYRYGFLPFSVASGECCLRDTQDADVKSLIGYNSLTGTRNWVTNTDHWFNGDIYTFVVHL